MASEWLETTIGELVPFSYGKGLPDQRRNAAGTIPVFGSNGAVGLHDVPLTEGPAIIIGRKGTVGAVHYCPAPCWPIDTTFWVSDPDHIALRFKYYLLKSLNLQEMNTDSAVPGLNREAAHARQITVPPLPQQHAISHILGTLDDKIELNRRMNQTLEATAQALFKSWFVDFEPFRDQGMQDSTLGEIPVGWRVTSLAELYPNDKECVITGPFGSTLHAHDYRDAGTPLILVKHVNHGHIDERELPLVGDHKLPELSRYQLKSGDVVFTRVGAVGRSALVDSRQEGWLISGQMLRVRAGDERIRPIYLAQLYLTSSFIAMVEAYALGTTRPSLNTKILEDFRFVCPPPEVQREYADKVLPLNLRVQQNFRESQTLSVMRDALLPKLLSGEIRVKDAERFVEKRT